MLTHREMSQIFISAASMSGHVINDVNYVPLENVMKLLITYTEMPQGKFLEFSTDKNGRAHLNVVGINEPDDPFAGETIPTLGEEDDDGKDDPLDR